MARELAKLKDQWQGTVVFVAQPAEEIGAGARAMLNDGLYTRWPKPNFALGLHDNAQMEIGTDRRHAEGYTYANVDSVDVTVRGVGGHGAYPHKTKDPIVLAAEIINAWQTIVSRENNPIDPVVVTVGSIHGGTKHNIIPDEVKMQLTVRSYKKEMREQVLAAIAQIAKGCAIAGGWPQDKCPIVQVRQNEFTPATYNNPELTNRLVAVWKKSLGEKTSRSWIRQWGAKISRSIACPITRFPQSIFTSARSLRKKSRPQKSRARRPCPVCIRASLRPCRNRPSAREWSR